MLSDNQKLILIIKNISSNKYNLKNYSRCKFMFYRIFKYKSTEIFTIKSLFLLFFSFQSELLLLKKKHTYLLFFYFQKIYYYESIIKCLFKVATLKYFIKMNHNDLFQCIDQTINKILDSFFALRQFNSIVSDLENINQWKFKQWSLTMVGPLNFGYYLISIINILIGLQSMLLQWGLILSVTTVSVTMLMILGQFLAVLSEASQFYNVSITSVLLLTNSFNLFHMFLTPFVFNFCNKYYFQCVIVSTIATGIASIGRYFAGTNYQMALVMTIVIAIAHIPIITAPYGLLKLFPEHQKGYATSIPLFLPVLGINFCIMYGFTFIASDADNKLPLSQVHDQIHNLNFIVAVVGVISTVLTLILMFKLKARILEEPTSNESQQQEQRSFLQNIKHYGLKHKHYIKILLFWGTLVGVNWTYGSLFGLIFKGQGLSEKQIQILGLVANLSSAILSNLGTFIKNRFNTSTTKIIGYLNLIGFLAALVIQGSKQIPLFQNLSFLVLMIVVLRAGFSSFVALAFMELQKSAIPYVILSGVFFWVANIVNYFTMMMVDLVDINFTMLCLTITIGVCIFKVSQSYMVVEK